MAPEPTARGRGRGRVATRGRGRGARQAGAVGAEPGTPSAVGHETQASSDMPEVKTEPQSAAGARGVPVAKPTRGPISARFRPKNIRRDEAARDALARQEQNKDNARAKEEARRQARSRGRSRRSRGDVMGRGGMNRQSAATGPFSQFLEESRGWGSRSGGGGGGGGGGSSSGFGGLRGVKGEKGGFGSAGGHREARINADRFAGLPPGHEPDSEDEATAELIGANPSAVWPMGIMRIDRKEEKKALATSAELEAEEQAAGEESLFVDGELYTVTAKQSTVDDNEVWHAAPQGVSVKAEPGSNGIPDVKPIDFDAHAKQVVAMDQHCAMYNLHNL